jgi:hypothetical protein
VTFFLFFSSRFLKMRSIGAYKRVQTQNYGSRIHNSGDIAVTVINMTDLTRLGEPRMLEHSCFTHPTTNKCFSIPLSRSCFALSANSLPTSIWTSTYYI